MASTLNNTYKNGGMHRAKARRPTRARGGMTPNGLYAQNEHKPTTRLPEGTEVVVGSTTYKVAKDGSYRRIA